MKNFKHILGTLLVATLIFTACENNDNDDLIIPATAAEFNSIRENALENITQNFQFDAADGAVSLTSDKGVTININTACLTNNGNAITGAVNLEFVEIFDKATMLKTNKTTMGIMPNGDQALLITGGAFFVEATQNGINLATNCPFELIIPGALTGGVDNGMILWNGIIDDEGELAWEEVGRGGAQGENGVFVEGTNYYAFMGNFGWSNVDKFYSDPRPKTTILASVPLGYDNTNCAIYLSYDGEASGLARLDTYDPLTGLFSEHYGQIPIGLECHAIFVSEENGNWKYDVQAVTITANSVIAFTNSNMAIATDAQLTSIIDALP